jgi:hypothetical protein
VLFLLLLWRWWWWFIVVIVRTLDGSGGRRRRIGIVALQLSDLLEGVSFKGIQFFCTQVPLVIVQFHFCARSLLSLRRVVHYHHHDCFGFGKRGFLGANLMATDLIFQLFLRLFVCRAAAQFCAECHSHLHIVFFPFFSGPKAIQTFG